MEMPNRKQNRLPEYDYRTGGAYFVTLCTEGRAQILSTIVGDGFPVPLLAGKIIETCLAELPEKYPGVSVERYVIMPDHVHILLRLTRCEGTGNPSPTLGTILGWLKYTATKRINEICGNAGKRVFQRSYYDHVIRNEADYREVWEYIEGNPGRWLEKRQGKGRRQRMAGKWNENV